MAQEIMETKSKKKHKPLTATGKLSGWWVKFFDKTREFECIQVGKWKEHHLVGYICKRFQDIYKIPYSFSLKGAPSTCPEMFMIKKIIYMLNNDNPRFIKDYVDWVFDKKIIPQKKKLTSFGFFATPQLANEFQIFHAESKKIRRSSPLPEEYQKLADNMEIGISTFGELAFIKLALEANNGDDLQKYNEFMNCLYSICFDENVLNNLED